MKKTLKSFGIKSLAAFLSVLMILTALPISVFAADTSNRIPKSKVDDSDIFCLYIYYIRIRSENDDIFSK